MSDYGNCPICGLWREEQACSAKRAEHCWLRSSWRADWEDEMQQKRDELVKQRDYAVARFNAEIEELDRQIMQEAHEAGLRRSPKWSAMTPAQRNHCAFLGFDPDEPEVPTD